jgi:hypothetical protein
MPRIPHLCCSMVMRIFIPHKAPAAEALAHTTMALGSSLRVSLLNFWTRPMGACMFTDRTFSYVPCFYVFQMWPFRVWILWCMSHSLHFRNSCVFPFPIQALCIMTSVMFPSVLLIVLKASKGFRVLLMSPKYLQRSRLSIPTYCTCTHKRGSK